jgi:hypothetical protein
VNFVAMFWYPSGIDASWRAEAPKLLDLLGEDGYETEQNPGLGVLIAMNEVQRLWELWGRRPSAEVISGKAGERDCFLQGPHPQNDLALAGITHQNIVGDEH